MPAPYAEPVIASKPSLDVYVNLNGSGKTYRLPGPLALVQTDCGSSGSQEITHVNTLSLQQIADSCPQAASDDDITDHSSCGGTLLSSISRGDVTVRAFTVVAVHSGLLVPQAQAPPKTPAAAGPPQQDAGSEGQEAAEHRSLLRAAARLTWGLAGIVFELMHTQAGHWPGLGLQVQRQAVAGAVLTQLYRLNRNLALGVLRAYGLLTPDRFDEMLEHGLLPPPAAAKASASAPGLATAGHGACDTVTAPWQHQAECDCAGTDAKDCQAEDAAASVRAA